MKKIEVVKAKETSISCEAARALLEYAELESELALIGCRVFRHNHLIIESVTGWMRSKRTDAIIKAQEKVKP